MAKQGYHHGNLRQALVEAGLSLARTGGPRSVVLRAASREAGVSHNAAYRHFEDREALLAAVSQRCMGELGGLMSRRLSSVSERPEGSQPWAWARLNALGAAYVEFARTEPGWFQTAFSATGSHAPVLPPASEAAPHPFLLLVRCLDDLTATGAVPADRRHGSEYAAWSAVHGLSHLLIDGPLRDLPEQEVQLALRKTLSVVSRGL
ncbi:TetR/AcrR family transcriptional regulator [Streptomyces sp. NPDC004284]|uniref:TetR/AcrR family transcriptional regulator n=1 Tax=Streptomyces sp. NPDC004284 TaxID=3364695 RepID=UPI00369B2A52